MRCILTANVKDEHNLNEWIKYHLLLGFDFILLWDDFSKLPIQCQHEKVRVIREHFNKNDYMTNSVAFAKQNGFDWIIHLDVDEYLYLGVNVRLTDFINTFGGDDIMAIFFPWVMFGSNNINVLNPKGSCLKPFVKCATKTHKYIKHMARVNMIIGVRSPHEYLYSQSYTPQNTVLAPCKKLRSFIPVQTREIQPVSPNRCFIAHYRFQSWDIFCQRKGRPRDDTQKDWKFSFDLNKDPPAFFHIDSNHIHFPYVLENFIKWSNE